MIEKFPYSFEKQLEVQAWPEPKQIWVNGNEIIVTTGSDLPPPPSAQDQIIALEGQAGSRMQREAWLASYVPVTDADRAYYAKVAEINAQIAELRGKL